jgi:hypothetical protein
MLCGDGGESTERIRLGSGRSQPEIVLWEHGGMGIGYPAGDNNDDVICSEFVCLPVAFFPLDFHSLLALLTRRAEKVKT